MSVDTLQLTAPDEDAMVALGAALATAAVLLAIPLLITWLQTGLVPRFPPPSSAPA